MTERLVAVDALRGLAIASMILVNNPGDWGHVYPPLRHAEWHGCTFTDLVFPTFLFVVGVSIAIALGGALARGRTPRELVPRIVRRSLLLVLFGFLLGAFPFVEPGGESLFGPLVRARWPGVLQRIGVCYLCASLLFVGTSPTVRRRVLIACLIGYWPLLALCPTPDGGAPDLATPGDHLAGWLDRVVFGSHAYKKGPYDPEGLLSTIGAIATTLLGVHAGRIVAPPAAAGTAATDTGDRGDVVRRLLLLGAGWTAVGAVWGWVFPINKALWTSSYALFTAGIAATGLGLCVHLFEVRGLRRLAHPLQVYGRNALLVFLGSGVLGRIVGRLWHVGDGAGAPSAQAWFHAHAFASWAPPEIASLLFALVWVGGWYVVLAWLWRRNLIWRL